MSSSLISLVQNLPHIVRVQRKTLEVDQQGHDANKVIAVDSVVLVDHEPLHVSEFGGSHVLERLEQSVCGSTEVGVDTFNPRHLPMTILVNGLTFLGKSCRLVRCRKRSGRSRHSWARWSQLER